MLRHVYNYSHVASYKGKMNQLVLAQHSCRNPIASYYIATHRRYKSLPLAGYNYII